MISAFEALEGHVTFPTTGMRERVNSILSRFELLTCEQQKGENCSGGSNSISPESIATLAPVFLLLSVIFIIFLILQKSLDCIYAPRTFLDSLNKDERTLKRGS